MNLFFLYNESEFKSNIIISFLSLFINNINLLKDIICTKKIDELSLRRLQQPKDKIEAIVHQNYADFKEIHTLLIDILNEVEYRFDDMWMFGWFEETFGDFSAISVVRDGFTGFLKYMENTQSNDVLTKIDKILYSANGNIVFDLLKQGYVIQPKSMRELRTFVKSMHDVYPHFDFSMIDISKIDNEKNHDKILNIINM